MSKHTPLSPGNTRPEPLVFAEGETHEFAVESVCSAKQPEAARSLRVRFVSKFSAEIRWGPASRVRTSEEHSAESCTSGGESVRVLAVPGDQLTVRFLSAGDARAFDKLLRHPPVAVSRERFPASGSARYVFSEGVFYEGEWLQGRRSGQGTQRYGDKSTYTGTWANGRREGKGTLKERDGTVYTGGWRKDRKHGRGREIGPRGEYEGGFVGGRRHGSGREKVPGGGEFVGQYVDGQRHGVGTFTWPDGASEMREYDMGVVQSSRELQRKTKGASPARAATPPQSVVVSPGGVTKVKKKKKKRPSVSQ